MQSTFPSLTVPAEASGLAPTLGDLLVDEYLESIHARLRPNSTLAVAYDLKVFLHRLLIRPGCKPIGPMELHQSERTSPGSEFRSVTAK